MSLELLFQGLIALGTVGAVIVALFGDWLRARFVPPKLKLELQNPLGTSTPVVLTSPDRTTRQEQGRVYHVKVRNERRWSPARDVQVFLLRIEEADAAGRDQPTWTGEVPVRWRDQEVHPLARTIGAAADCDLCTVVKGKWVELQPLIQLTSLNSQRREPFRLIATLQARSIETDSGFLRVCVAWDGQWSDGEKEMAQHLVIRQL